MRQSEFVAVSFLFVVEEDESLLSDFFSPESEGLELSESPEDSPSDSFFSGSGDFL